MRKILIIDNADKSRKRLSKFLSKNGYECLEAVDGKSGEELLRNNAVDLVCSDFTLPDYDGIDIIRKIKILQPLTPIVIIASYSNVRSAVEALKKGAAEYITKPLNPDELLNAIEDALNKHAEKFKHSEPKTESNPKFIIGKSQPSLQVEKHIRLISPTDMSVLILGETGTGKEYVAKSIHHQSKRKKAPFVAIDCGALPENLAASELFGHKKGAFTGAIADKKGCFELADEGTLFLDEIGNLSYDNQVKLLRVLQEQKVRRLGATKGKKVNVRVIAATNDNLEETISNGEFREDIYYRLNEFKIELAPLRKRKDDIPLFIDHFMNESNAKLNKMVRSITPRAMKLLKAHSWDGNLRELKNVIKRAVLFAQDQLIDISELPSELKPDHFSKKEVNVIFPNGLPATLKQVTAEAEKSAIIETLKLTDNNKSKAAQRLGIDRKTLYNKLSQYSLL